MKRRNHSPERIVRMLRQADANIAAGSTIEQICKELGISLGISDATYYNWRKNYGKMRLDQLKQLKQLQYRVRLHLGTEGEERFVGSCPLSLRENGQLRTHLWGFPRTRC